ncbi:phosphoribosyltransferase [Nitrososphaera sp.]|uniref:phosphoribosyltransferase n=1 Tax=Nitrososphaera sp. TaxID=1971748 RepID=UPI0017ADF606|nr:phosphoribosyltransferase family protein [Nitrososphaera sp.]NWG37728.1 phosphoribosyltransferase [Nitrososphaera sp.]
MTFKDRRDAAAVLAAKLKEIYGREFSKEKPLILAIPRGGVVTGDEIAARLGADLDVVVSKKIGAPDNPELAIGAVMHDGSFFPNTDIIAALGVGEDYIKQQISEKMKEIERRLGRFRGSREYNLAGRTVVLVDDGIATGATVFAAINWLKEQKLKKLIVAMPVGPADTVQRLKQLVSDVVVLSAPVVFMAVGAFYEDFEQVSDDEVVEIMSKYRARE